MANLYQSFLIGPTKEALFKMTMNFSRFRIDQAALPHSTTIRLQEIPEKYLPSPGNVTLPWNRRFGRLGRGVTSIVVNDPKDPNKVLVFTRDDQKKDWLVFGNHGLAVKWLESFNSNKNGKDLADFPIYVLSMPKLKPLNKEQAAQIKEQTSELSHLLSMNHGQDREQEAYQLFMDTHPNSPITPVVEHLQNYDPSQFLIDMHKFNFMQDNQGRIYATDPVVSRELLKILRKRYDIHAKRAW